MNKLKYVLCDFLKDLYDNPIALYMFVFFGCATFVAFRLRNKALLSDNHQYVEIVNQFIQVPFGSYVVLGAVFGLLFANSVLTFSILHCFLKFLCSTQKFKNVLEKSDSLD